MKRPCVLQINQSGAWRTALDFDATGLPDEFLHHADQLARLATNSPRMRIVVSAPGENGRPVATQTVLKHWSRETGWVDE